MSYSDRSTATRGRRYSRAVRADGLIVVRRRGFGVTDYLAAALVALSLLTAFKACVLASYGAQGYEARVGSLAEGTLAEGVSSLLLGADPATRWLASWLAPAFG